MQALSSGCANQCEHKYLIFLSNHESMIYALAFWIVSKSRPIIVNIGSLTERLSNFDGFYVRPLAEKFAHI